jgi:hypothetical protein
MRTASRYECSSRQFVLCERGYGKPTRKKCAYCKSPFTIYIGYWGVFKWNSENRYPIEEALELFSNFKKAEKAADTTYHSLNAVVRWITEMQFTDRG